MILTWILPSEEPAKSISPSLSDVKDVIFAFPPIPILTEAILVTLSFNHTSTVPNLVAVKMKSLFTVMQFISNPVVSDPTTALEEIENTCIIQIVLVGNFRTNVSSYNDAVMFLTFPATPSTDEPPAKRRPS